LITVRVVPHVIPDGVAYAEGTVDEDAAAPADAAEEHPLTRMPARHSTPAAGAVPIHRPIGRFVVTSAPFESRSVPPWNLRMSGLLP
jgi:hypothetical protein